MDVREKLVELLSKYFDICDSYCYNLTRTKNAFACGTMGFDDFEEFDEETVADIADHLIANGVTFATDNNVGSKWIPVTERLPEGFTSCIVYRVGSFGGHYSMLRYSPELGWHFYDSECGDVTVNDVTHWMPLPVPPKGE